MLEKIEEEDTGRYVFLDFDLSFSRRMMNRFAASECGPDVGENLLESLNGKRSYPRFRSILESEGILEEWRRYYGERQTEEAERICGYYGISLEK